MLYGQFHEREFLLMSFIGGSDVLKVVVIAYVIGGYNGKYHNWS